MAKVLIVGNQDFETELKRKLGLEHHYTVLNVPLEVDYLNKFDFVFDANFDQNLERFKIYNTCNKPIIVLNMVTTTTLIAAEKGKTLSHNIVGANLWPGFIDKPLWEIYDLIKAQDHQKILVERLQVETIIVHERIGFVAPRVIAMVINEAYFTLQEHTATPQDIDVAMKLGTAYPKGPFEWKKIIGIANIYNLLEALYLDTHDERYKACQLLKTEYLKHLLH